MSIWQGWLDGEANAIEISSLQHDPRDSNILARLVGKWNGSNGSEYELFMCKPGRSISVWTKYRDGKTRYTTGLIRFDHNGSSGPYGISWGSGFYLDKCGSDPDSRQCDTLAWRHHNNSPLAFQWTRNFDAADSWEKKDIGRPTCVREKWADENEQAVDWRDDVEITETSDAWEQSMPKWRALGSKLEPQILYESDYAQVLNKGPLWLCEWNSHGSKSFGARSSRGSLHHDTRSWQQVVDSGKSELLDVYVARKFQDDMACQWWDAQRKHEDSGASAAGFVHRLDLRTSGCILRAKNSWSFERLKHQLRRGWMKKVYTCLVHGTIPPNCVHVFVSNLTYDRHTRSTFVDEHACDNSAETWVRCSKHLIGKCSRRYSLCDVQIVTGRTHQIRAHMSLTGTPLVTDFKYNENFAREDAEWCPRLFLHARRLCFWDGDQEVSVEAPLPCDLTHALERLILESDFGDNPSADFDAYMSASRSPKSHMPGESEPVPTEPDFPMLSEALCSDIIEARRVSGGAVSLSSLVRNVNIRYKLRVLQYGGADLKDIDRLELFIRDRIANFDQNEEHGTAEVVDLLQ